MAKSATKKKKANASEKLLKKKADEDADAPPPPEPKTEDKEEEDDEPSTIELKLRQKKPLPSVSYLLEHGARDPDAPPETFLESLVLPGLLLLTFVLSFVAWHFLFLKDAGPGQKKNWSEL